MKLKKIASVIVSCMLAGSILTGCGGDTAEKPAAKEGGDSIKIGMIVNLNVSEQKLDEVMKKVEENSGVKVSNHITTYYNNLNLMLMGIESGSVNEISTYQSVANYLIAENNKFEILKNHSLHLKDSLCFALRDEDDNLKNELNKALEEIKNEGTLDKLTKEYITDYKKDSIITPIEIAHIDGANTIKVAITGDLPPLDYVDTEGKAAGFNTALLSEVSKKINRNIELVQVDSAARASALTSKKVDVVFWAIMPIGNDRPEDMDIPKGVELSTPYFTDEIVHLDMKK